MNIIIDSNILFAALIRDSIVRKIIFEYDGYFLFPSFIFEELEKYKPILFKKSNMQMHEFNKILELILTKVIIIPNEVILPYKEKAHRIIKDIDVNDIIFIACVLAYPNSVLWSDDKKLKLQNTVKIMNTSEIKDFVLNKIT